jgi:hypothetical protein
VFGRRRELERELDKARADAAEARLEAERSASDPLAQRVGETVVVHLENRQSVAGILARVHETAVVLHAARLLVEGTGAVSMDGEEHIIPRKRIMVVNVGVTIDDARLQS